MRSSVCAMAACFAAALWVQLASASPGVAAPREVQRIPGVLVTADEAANPQLYHPQAGAVFEPPPALPTPPPDGSIRPGEFEEMDSVLIAPVDYGTEYLDMYEKMVVAYAAAGHVWINATAQAKESLEQRLTEAGVAAGATSYLNIPVDSIWIRDYGPEFSVSPDGVRRIWDGNYSSGSGPDDRPNDDNFPLIAAAGDWINSDGAPVEVMLTAEHFLAGGNIMTDGAGTCFFSNIVYGYEMPSGWTEEDVDALMLEYLGCEQIISLNPICLDGTGHIDLYAKIMTPTSILLGEFPADTHFAGATESGWAEGYCADPHHPNDYQDQEDNLAILEASLNLDGDPWVITRMPTPEPYEDDWGWWIYRSYMNSQVFNGAVAMPSYYDPHGGETADDLLNMEAAAIAAYETAAPGVVVTPIAADHIVGLGGAMHCITHEIPAEAGGGWTAPEEYCGDGIANGDDECDGDDFGGATCADYGLGLGADLLCGYGCTIDTSGCPGAACGDGIVGEGEECDPCAPTGLPCAELGLGEGEAGCASDCTINYMACPGSTSPCALVAATDPGVICCPEGMAQDCNASTWEFSPEDSFYGCCTPDMTAAVWCESTDFVVETCPGVCGYLAGDGYILCDEGEPPEELEPVEGCPDDTPDAGSDGGPGDVKGDDGCSCRAAGASTPVSLLALLFG